ncbi:MAG: hypothetical protein ACD_46C00539G0007 [uncultured bacterium]|nr:MAG: hypothetical protein ACD_46C00539G0007 [uncultured bacterium]
MITETAESLSKKSIDQNWQLELFALRFEINGSDTWEYVELIKRCLTCWDTTLGAYAAGLLLKRIGQSDNPANDDLISNGF